MPLPRTRLIVRTTALLLLLALPVVGGAHSRAPLMVEGPAAGEEPQEEAPETLKIMTLNLAHGRGAGRHQLLQRKPRHLENLDRVVALLVREQPDIVALQEADGASFWSGEFGHVAYLAHKAGFPWFARGDSVSALGLQYGQGLLSRFPLDEVEAWAFAPTPPSTPKGLLVAEVHPPGWPPLRVASVHLDFMHSSARIRQVGDVVAALEGASSPVIVMGDLNAQWISRESTVRDLAHGLRLRGWRPREDGLATYRSSGRRLDWMLVDQQLDMVRYEVLDDPVSDHQPVLAEVRRLPAAGAISPAEP